MLDQFYKQQNRGVEGFGVYDGVDIVHKTEKRDITNWLRENPRAEILFHHRKPTSTANTLSACHPFTTGDFFKARYTLIHNGVIWNDYTLKNEHEKMGITYQSIQPDHRYNDSEALLWDVALYLEGRQTELTAKGSIAFIVLEETPSGGRYLHFARNSSPLKMVATKHKLFLSSEGPGEMIDANKLYSVDLKTATLSSKPLTVPDYVFARETRSSQSNWFDQEDELFIPAPRYVEAITVSTEDRDTFRSDVIDQYTQYMSAARGVFQVALDMLEEDLADCVRGMYEGSEAQAYEMSVKHAVMGSMFISNYWHTGTHASYVGAKPIGVLS